MEPVENGRRPPWPAADSPRAGREAEERIQRAHLRHPAERRADVDAAPAEVGLITLEEDVPSAKEAEDRAASTDRLRCSAGRETQDVTGDACATKHMVNRSREQGTTLRSETCAAAPEMK